MSKTAKKTPVVLPPVLPTRDDPVESNDERLLGEVPPHWGD